MAHASWELRWGALFLPEMVSVPIDETFVAGVFDWIWHNPNYPDYSVIGNAGWSSAPGNDKGLANYSCTGLLERAAEEAGFDMLPQ